MPASGFANASAGIARAAQMYAEMPLAQARMSEALMRQERAAMELQEYRTQAPVRQQQQDLVMAQLQDQLKQLQATNARNTTFEALDRFGVDYDVKHLNSMLTNMKNNPVAETIWGQVSTFEPLYRSDENTELLKSMGIEDVDGVYDNPEWSKQFVKAIGNNGDRAIRNIEDLRALTGYNRFDHNRTMEEKERDARLLVLLKQGQSTSQISLRDRVVQDLVRTGQATGIPDAYGMLLELEGANKPRGSSAQERMIAARMESTGETWAEAYEALYMRKGESNEQAYIREAMETNPNMTYEDAASQYKNLGRTSTQKHLYDIAGIREELRNQKWLETDSSTMDPQARQQVYTDLIAPLEDLRNIKFTTEEKREMRKLRQLSALGAKAGEQLTEEETGLLDSAMFGLKRYMTDDIGGQQGVTAYETFRNLFRHDLYGTALTGAEIGAFNKSLGGLGQKLNPVLEQLRTQMESIKGNLESIRDTNDPDIAHYYLGMPIEDIDAAIERIEHRLANPRLQLKASNKTLTTQKKAATSEGFDLEAALREQGLL